MPNLSEVIREVLAGDCLQLQEISNLLHVDTATLQRWFHYGTKALDGHLVHLELIRLGGKFATSQAALTRFLQATSSVKADMPISEETRKSRKKEKVTNK